ncbi:hypothetical protein BDQ12DRAFT_759193 [Crucibulum laeve]|uniref:Uncharacterized protein n=1 Tax=Crucibulum laeve TaxID=68775 RepID=A0A5C3LR31_9AGAR|nr:hypothetical protein BDQ12DRAFT_759193 [Crucibulum laeve]
MAVTRGVTIAYGLLRYYTSYALMDSVTGLSDYSSSTFLGHIGIFFTSVAAALYFALRLKSDSTKLTSLCCSLLPPVSNKEDSCIELPSDSLQNAPSELQPHASPATAQNPPLPALPPERLSRAIVQVQKAHTRNIIAKSKKSAFNRKIYAKIQYPSKIPGFLSMNSAQKEEVRKEQERSFRRAKAKALSDSRKRMKETRRNNNWTNVNANQAGGNGASRHMLRKDEKQQVSNAISLAGRRMQETVNIPHRADEFRVGYNMWTGVEVRRAIMNLYLYAPFPVGRINRNASFPLSTQPGFLSSMLNCHSSPQPKPFANSVYRNTHQEVALRGQKPIPYVPDQLHLEEYPVLESHPSGWVGGGSVGPGHVIISQQDADGNADTFWAVIGHDSTRGGEDEDHYLATLSEMSHCD